MLPPSPRLPLFPSSYRLFGACCLSSTPLQAAPPGADQAAGAAVPSSGTATSTATSAEKPAPASGGALPVTVIDTVAGDGGKGGAAGANAEGAAKESGVSKAPETAAVSSEVRNCLVVVLYHGGA